MKKLTLASVLVFCFAFRTDKIITIKPTASFPSQVHEPSDVCLAPSGESMYVVDDSGLLFETDLNGKILRKAQKTKDYNDFEAVCTDGGQIYVSAESDRKILVFDSKSFELVHVVAYDFNSLRNAGFESMTMDPETHCFFMVSEKNPIVIRKYSADFRLMDEKVFSGASDISSATWHNHALWLLSDEDRTLFKLDSTMQHIASSWRLPVLNPEGFFFDNSNVLRVASDDMERIFIFNDPETHVN
jgi:uncharacterized protein YjiK